MKTTFAVSRMLAVAALTFHLADGSGHAHTCPASPITVEVGRITTCRILADVQESEPSFYNMSINAQPSIATVAPDNMTSFNYGEFVIRGVSPGTNQIVLEWFYPPFDASGFCVVDVIVVEPSPATSGTAANYEQSATANDPVNLLTGELVFNEEADLDLGGPMPLVFQRYYASRLHRDGLVQSSVGKNWAHNFDLRLLRVADSIEVVFYQGRRIAFQWNGTAWQPVGPSPVPFQLVEDGTDYILADPGDQRRYTFNALGQLLQIADGKGNTHSLTYEGLLVKQVADGLGRTLTFNYAGFQELSTVSDGTRTVQFVRSGPNLFRATNVVGDHTEYTYDDTQAGGGLLTSRKLPRGNIPFTQTYDMAGRVSSQADAVGNTWQFAYTIGSDIVTALTDPLDNARTCRHNMLGQLTSLTDENDRTISFGYTAGRRTSLLDREGALTEYSFDAGAGRVAAIHHANGGVTLFTYASRTAGPFTFYDLVEIIHPDGTGESFSYDANGNRIRHTNQLGNVHAFSYNDRGQMLSSTNAAGGSITYSYNSDATLASITDHSGNTTLLNYNALRQVIGEVHADGTSRRFTRNHRDQILQMTNEIGGVVVYSYDKNGNRTQELDALGYATTYYYDQRDRLTKITSGGESIDLAYDQPGRLKTLTDRRGNATAWNYDPAGRIVSVVDAGGQAWKQRFDAEGVLLSRTDPLENTEDYSSDAMGKINAVSTAGGSVYAFVRDVMGRIIALHQPDGRTTSRFHDNRGSLTEEALPGGFVTAQYERNALGEIARITDPNGRIWESSFDAQGRVTTRRDPLGHETLYEYDARNRPVRVFFPSGLGELEVSYDGLNAITRRLYSDGTDLAYNYNAKGHFIGGSGITLERNNTGDITNCNGLGVQWQGGMISSLTLAPTKSISYAYNSRNLVTNITDWMGQSVTFTYDAAGQLKTVTRANGVNAAFTHNADGQLTALSDGPASILLERDVNGRIATAERNTPLSATSMPETHNFSYDAASQTATASHDALGNILTAGSRTFSWDLASRLSSYSEDGNVVSFTYDGMGNRLTRTEGGSTESSVWNYALAIPSISVLRRNGADAVYYVHTPDGRLLYSMDAVTGSRRFYHFDEMGNTLFLSDDAGTVIASYARGPYGEILNSTGVMDNPFIWQGRFGVMQEGNSGLYYMRARYYDSEAARFLSRDPLHSTLPDAVNPYQYARSNPLRYIDPLGLDPTGPQGAGHQVPQQANGSQRQAAVTKPDPELSQTEDEEEGEPPRWQRGETVYLTDREWNIEVALTKKKLRDRVKQYGWWDPQTAMGFDSIFIRYQRTTFYFRGEYMNGGNLNYYFQGMLWAEMGMPKEILIAAIYNWKWYKYGTNPSPLDTFAACEGFKDNANFVTELRSEFQNEVNKLPSVPRVVLQEAARPPIVRLLEWLWFD